LIVTGVTAVTLKWFTANVALEAPAGTMTESGTVAAVGLELVSVTFVPLLGAIPVIVMVPVTEFCDPPSTDVGEIVMLATD